MSIPCSRVPARPVAEAGRSDVLFSALALVTLILGLAYTVAGIAGLVRGTPAAPIMTGFGVAVSGLGIWLRRWLARRPRG